MLLFFILGIKMMVGILRHKGKGYDDALPYLDDYIAKHEPEWKSKYLGEKPKSEINENKKGFGNYMAENVADMAYGADRALSGATFGGYDWLKRKTGIGINQTDYLNMKRYNDGTDKPAKIGGIVSEIGGNIVGGGKNLVNSLQRMGLHGKCRRICKSV